MNKDRGILEFDEIDQLEMICEMAVRLLEEAKVVLSVGVGEKAWAYESAAELSKALSQLYYKLVEPL
jgi:hypothetical protein